MIEKLKNLEPIPNMLVMALLVLLFILTTQTSAIGQTLCDGKVATIVGTEGSDEINGTEGPDVIHGLGGNDIIRGMGGDDVICGGDGHDVIGGGSGNDTVFGENGNDSIWGGTGNDILRGGDGTDSIYGGPGDDNLYGNHGNDTLYGITGVDRLYGGWGEENNDSCYDDAGTFIWGCEQFNGEYIPPAPVPNTGHPDNKTGVPWPDPRFTDNGDGTVTDNLTGLIWLKNQKCLVQSGWGEAVEACTNLAHGQCGLSDGSAPGDWRLPNASELYSLIHYTHHWVGARLPGEPFERHWPYKGMVWSSTGFESDVYGPTANVWILEFWGGSGSVRGIRVTNICPYGEPDCETEDVDGVWPVRGGN